jgi:hypothetical protein
MFLDLAFYLAKLLCVLEQFFCDNSNKSSKKFEASSDSFFFVK